MSSPHVSLSVSAPTISLPPAMLPWLKSKHDATNSTAPERMIRKCVQRMHAAVSSSLASIHTRLQLCLRVRMLLIGVVLSWHDQGSGFGPSSTNKRGGGRKKKGKKEDKGKGRKHRVLGLRQTKAQQP